MCGLCQTEPGGRIEKTNNPSFGRRFFSQDDINKGKIAFQHFMVSGGLGVCLWVVKHILMVVKHYWLFSTH